MGKKRKKGARESDAAVAAVAPRERVSRSLDLRAREVIGRVTGARLCYGKPVTNGAHTVVPVASVQAAGGGGFGSGGDDDGDGSGGGGGGALMATPVGYIEIGPDGARFRRIIDPLAYARATAAVLGALAAVGGVRAARGAARARPRRGRRRRRRGLLLLR